MSVIAARPELQDLRLTTSLPQRAVAARSVGGRARLLLLGAVAAYISIFWWTYAVCVAPRFDYFGLGYDPDWPWSDVIFVVVLAFTPALWMPVRVARPSQFFLLMQYIVIYIPALFIAHHSVLPVLETRERTLLCVTLAGGLAILLSAQSLPLLRIPSLPLSRRTYTVCLVVSLVVGMAYIAAVLGGNFRLVSLANIYSVRDQVNELLDATGNRLSGYVFTWLNSVILPLVFAASVTRKRWFLVLLVPCCYLFLYGVWGSKVSFFGPIYLLGLYGLMRFRLKNVPPMLMLICAASLAVPLAIEEMPSLDLLAALWTSIVNLRMFAVPGLLVVQYSKFFSEHPITMGSHVTGIDLLVRYPYDYDIPRTVGFHFYESLLTSNVNYWAQDGLAGFGLPGILLMSVVAAVTFWLLDSVTKNLSPRFVMVALGPTALTILNVSLFTSLLTGGLLLFFIAFLLSPKVLYQASATSKVGDAA